MKFIVMNANERYRYHLLHFSNLIQFQPEPQL